MWWSCEPETAEGVVPPKIVWTFDTFHVQLSRFHFKRALAVDGVTTKWTTRRIGNFDLSHNTPPGTFTFFEFSTTQKYFNP
jgi:hypothetical protein